MDKPLNSKSVIPSKKRPDKKIRQIAALFCAFCYALLGWLRFFSGLRYELIFTELNLWPRPLYIILSGLAIGSTFSAGTLFILFRAKVTPSYFKILGMVFLVWLWFDNIWLGTREAFFNQVIVTLLITFITLTFIFIFIKNEDYHKGNSDDAK